MKITHNKVGQNLNTSDAKTNKAGEAGAANAATKNNKSNATQASSEAGAQAAKVELSPRAKDIQTIKEMAKNSPDVNVDKVEKFKRLIAEGKYKVDAKAVADRMVDEHLKSSGKASND